MFTKVAIQLALVTILGSAGSWTGASVRTGHLRRGRVSSRPRSKSPNQKTPEITTEQLQAILKAGLIPVFDVRTAEEYAIAHIPGSINIYEKEVEHILEVCPPDRDAPGCPKFLPGSPGTLLSPRMILYCNGPSCGKSKRTSDELLALGYTAADVSRYQLGLPVWRALSLTVQTNMPGLLYIFTRDHTSVFVDARTPAEFAEGTIPGAVNVQKGEAVAANDDGRLPFRDKSTRVVVFGNTADQAMVVGAEIAKRAYWGSSYFGGTFGDSAGRWAHQSSAGGAGEERHRCRRGGVHGSDQRHPGRQRLVRPRRRLAGSFGASRHAAWPRRARRCSQRHRRPRCVEIRQRNGRDYRSNGAGDRAARHGHRPSATLWMGARDARVCGQRQLRDSHDDHHGPKLAWFTRTTRRSSMLITYCCERAWCTGSRSARATRPAMSRRGRR